MSEIRVMSSLAALLSSISALVYERHSLCTGSRPLMAAFTPAGDRVLPSLRLEGKSDFSVPKSVDGLNLMFELT